MIHYIRSNALAGVRVFPTKPDQERLMTDWLAGSNALAGVRVFPTLIVLRGGDDDE